MMVPDSKSRLSKNVEDLEVFVETAKDREGVKESEWWGTMEEVLGSYKGKEVRGNERAKATKQASRISNTTFRRA